MSHVNDYLKILTGMVISDEFFPVKDKNKFTPTLELRPAKLETEYRKKWKADMEYYNLYKDGIKLNDNLYRIGGMGGYKEGNKYVLLLKYVEALYDNSIIKMTGGTPHHLESRWCIINLDGVEKVNATKSYANLYLVNGSCIYSEDSTYYNIEDGEEYCNTSKKMETSEYLFLDNGYDKDESRRGVMKIDKEDGSFELFPE